MFRYGNGLTPSYPFGVWGSYTIIWPYLPEVLSNLSPKPAEWMAAHEYAERIYANIDGIGPDV